VKNRSAGLTICFAFAVCLSSAQSDLFGLVLLKKKEERFIVFITGICLTSSSLDCTRSVAFLSFFSFRFRSSIPLSHLPARVVDCVFGRGIRRQKERPRGTCVGGGLFFFHMHACMQNKEKKRSSTGANGEMRVWSLHCASFAFYCWLQTNGSHVTLFQSI